MKGILTKEKLQVTISEDKVRPLATCSRRQLQVGSVRGAGQGAAGQHWAKSPETVPALWWTQDKQPSRAGPCALSLWSRRLNPRWPAPHLLGVQTGSACLSPKGPGRNYSWRMRGFWGERPRFDTFVVGGRYFPPFELGPFSNASFSVSRLINYRVR